MYMEYWRRRRWLVRCLRLGLQLRRPNGLELRCGLAGRDIMLLLPRLLCMAGMAIALPWCMGTDTRTGRCMAIATDGAVTIDAMTGVAGAIVMTGAMIAAAEIVMTGAMEIVDAGNVERGSRGHPQWAALLFLGAGESRGRAGWYGG